MVSIGDYKVGFFLENKEYYKEIGEKYEIKNENDYASTCTSNVILLLDKDNKIVDIDDIPTDEAMEIANENFIAYLKGDNVCAFVVNINSNTLFLDDEDFTNIDSQGVVTFLQIMSDDFNLKISTDTNNSINIKDLKNADDGDMLLLYLDSNPKVEKNNNETNVSLLKGCAKIIKTHLGEL